METVTLIGTGRLGSALALALHRAGYDIKRLVFRNSEPLESVRSELPGDVSYLKIDADFFVDSDVTLITTQDTEIESVSETLAGRVGSKVVLHTSGSLPSSILRRLQSKDTVIGSMHPLVSVSEPHAGSARFAGAYFCIEGDGRAVETASRIAKDIGGRPFSIPTHTKPLYHAAAVMSSGHIVALTETAANVLETCGIAPDEARAILMPLIESTIDNLKLQSPARSMTGTYARLDVPAFHRHFAALEESSDESTLDVYLDLAIRSLELVRTTGIDRAGVERFLEEVYVAKRKRRVIK